MTAPQILAGIFGAMVLSALATIVWGVWWLSRMQVVRDDLEGLEVDGGWLFDEAPHPDALARFDAERRA